MGMVVRVIYPIVMRWSWLLLIRLISHYYRGQKREGEGEHLLFVRSKKWILSVLDYVSSILALFTIHASSSSVGWPVCRDKRNQTPSLFLLALPNRVRLIVKCIIICSSSKSKFDSGRTQRGLCSYTQGELLISILPFMPMLCFWVMHEE